MIIAAISVVQHFLVNFNIMKKVFGVNTPSEIKNMLENDFHDQIDELTMENAIRIANSLRQIKNIEL